jgi:acyl-coenzyme A synthetase/AMP-(fatty) acid ligase
MRLFLTGGPLSQAMADEAKARLTQQIYTYVSATEVTPFTLTPIEQPEDLRWHRILPSREVQIVDPGGRAVQAGQEGLLRVRVIDGVTGYFHDDETSRAFFCDGYFYSGDLGVIRRDGRLALLGRVTDVINVLGSKFAPGPIEDAVQCEFGVSAACIFSMLQADGEEVVHVAIESQQPIDLDRLVALLGSMLPNPFRAQVYFVDALPRNDMGKVQRYVLKHQLGLLQKASNRSHCQTYSAS